MSDIRRIILDASPASDVRAVPEETYQLRTEQIDQLEKVIQRLLTLDYYSPEYQAWEPFIQAYLKSGNNPSMMTRYGNKLLEKIEEFEPPKSQWDGMLEAILSANRSRSSEVYEGICWNEIIDFQQMVPKYIDQQRPIKSVLFSAANFNGAMQLMLQKKDNEKYSAKLPWAVYMFRHQMIQNNPKAAEWKEEIDKQVSQWVLEFASFFEMVAKFIGEQTDVYEWYQPNIMKLISQAWLSATDLSPRRSVISATDVFNMPVWLSEQITDYLGTLPCVLTTPVTPEYILDALEYAMGEDASYADKRTIYMFCIPQEYLKKFFQILGDFYWDVENKTIITFMRNRVASLYAEKKYLDVSTKTPEEYDAELLERGFPLEQMTGGDSSDGRE